MNSPNRNLAIVKAVRDQGEPVTKVAKRFGISRQRVYTILANFDAGGPDEGVRKFVCEALIEKECHR